jgi:hypothetical protein
MNKDRPHGLELSADGGSGRPAVESPQSEYAGGTVTLTVSSFQVPANWQPRTESRGLESHVMKASQTPASDADLKAGSGRFLSAQLNLLHRNHGAQFGQVGFGPRLCPPPGLALPASCSGGPQPNPRASRNGPPDEVIVHHLLRPASMIVPWFGIRRQVPWQFRDTPCPGETVQEIHIQIPCCGAKQKHGN